MENSKPKKDTLMWNIIEEHNRLAELDSKNPLLRYCKPFKEEGLLEWNSQNMDDFYSEFGPQKERKNSYEILIEMFKQKKEKPMKTKDIKTNYYNALRTATDQLNGIKGYE